MVKSELIKKIQDNFPSLIKSDIIKMVDIITSEIIGALCSDEFSSVELRGYGRFSTIIQKARKGRNPANGLPVSIPKKKKNSLSRKQDFIKKIERKLIPAKN